MVILNVIDEYIDYHKSYCHQERKKKKFPGEGAGQGGQNQEVGGCRPVIINILHSFPI